LLFEVADGLSAADAVILLLSSRLRFLAKREEDRLSIMVESMIARGSQTMK
jgi:hypothetical protein